MQAALFCGADEPLRLQTVDVAEPRADEVRVRLSAAGVCHSDHRVLVGEWDAPTPLVLGHEGAGIVESVGPHVTHVSAGDPVVLSWTPSCAHCSYCVSGRPQLCTTASGNAYRHVLTDGTTRITADGVPAFSYLSVGSFAQYAVVPAGGVVRLDHQVDPAVAALVGCAITTGVGAAVNTRPVAVGETVLVVGAGGVGLSVIMGARLQSPSCVIAVDVADAKLELAKRFGATHTVNARTDDVVAAIQDITGGRGVDVAYEAAGRVASIEQAFLALAPGGTVVVVGQVASGQRISIDPMRMSGRELTLTGSNYGSARPTVDFPRILELYRQGHLPLDELISRRIKLDQVNEAFTAMAQGEIAGRVVIDLP